MTSPMHEFLKLHRAQLTAVQGAVRIVHHSQLLRTTAKKGSLEAYIAQKAPNFYRPLDAFVDDLKQGFPLNTFKETLARIPQESTFQSSHFGEIAACLFAEEILGLRKLYSKLSLLTAETRV